MNSVSIRAAFSFGLFVSLLLCFGAVVTSVDFASAQLPGDVDTLAVSGALPLHRPVPPVDDGVIPGGLLRERSETFDLPGSRLPASSPRSGPALAPAEGMWSQEFGWPFPGTSYDVYAVTTYGTDLIVAGGFVYAGDVPVYGIARWDGTEWTSLGGGMDAPVHCLAVYNGELIAGGMFEMAGSTQASRIARWDGTQWRNLGSAYTDYGPVSCLTVHNGELIVGGGFRAIGGLTVSGIAKWNGTNWSVVSPTGSNASVISLAVYDGDLIAGGTFTSIGGVAVNRIARWDGSAWHPLGTGMAAGTYTPEVYAMTLYEGDLIAAGPFDTSGGVVTNSVARWDGTQWYALGSGVDVGTRAVYVYDGDLILGGAFTTADGLPASCIARWDGVSWHAMGDGTNDRVLALGEYGGALYAGGWFTEAGGVPAFFIALWNGTAWSAVGAVGSGQGVIGDVNTIASYGGELIVGGNFTYAGRTPASRIARWNGTEWKNLGTASTTYGPVAGLLEYEGDLIVAGGFEWIGGVYSPGIAIWDGSSWSAFSPGDPNGTVRALAIYNGDLIAGGTFTSIGGITVGRIARWDGVQWHPLGTGMQATGYTPEVYALAVYDGDLVAAGPFDTSGGVVTNSIARWDGTSWHAMGSGVNVGTRALAEFNGDLILGGAFTTADGQPAANIARWDGAAWHAMGAGFDSRVLALGVLGSRLFAGGWFTTADGAPASHIASWDGSAWNPLKEGINGDVHTIFPSGMSVYAGGAFTTAGGMPSYYFAEWLVDESIPVKLAAFSVGYDGASAVVEWEVAESFNHAGFHVYRQTSGDTRVRLSEDLLSGQTRYRFVDPEPPAGGADYWLEELDRAGGTSWHGPVTLEPRGETTRVLVIASAAPNPFRSATTIGYVVPERGWVELAVYDIQGRRVAVVESGIRDAGDYTAAWTGADDRGHPVAPGTYFLQLAGPGGKANRKVVLTR